LLAENSNSKSARKKWFSSKEKSTHLYVAGKPEAGIAVINSRSS
jgi:hypothetical protein